MIKVNGWLVVLCDQAKLCATSAAAPSASLRPIDIFLFIIVLLESRDPVEFPFWCGRVPALGLFIVTQTGVAAIHDYP